jgi:hypothetical protein
MIVSDHVIVDGDAEEEENESRNVRYSMEELEIAGMRRVLINVDPDGDSTNETGTTTEDVIAELPEQTELPPVPKKDPSNRDASQFQPTDAQKKMKGVQSPPAKNPVKKNRSETEKPHRKWDPEDTLPISPGLDVVPRKKKNKNVKDPSGNVKMAKTQEQEKANAKASSNNSNDASQEPATKQLEQDVLRWKKARIDRTAKETADIVRKLTPEELEFQKKYAGVRSTEFESYQTDLKVAEKKAASIAGVPFTRQQFDQWAKRKLNQSSDLTMAEKKEAVFTREKAFVLFHKKHKRVEAELLQWDSVSALRYNPLSKKDATKGSFTAILRKSGEEVLVEESWVKDNFKDDVVQAVMSSALSQFVEVGEEVNVLMDKRQIKKLRYFYTRDSATGNEQGFFQGITADGLVNRLSPSFVSQNFDKEFVDYVVKEGKERENLHYFFVPPGAPRTIGVHKMMDDRFPKLAYMQNGEATCLFSSFASALHHLHLTEQAPVVAGLAPKFSASAPLGVDNWKGLLSVMGEICPWLQPTKVNGNFFDIFHDLSEYPTALQLQAVDGGTQHAITVVGGLVFDSNCERAMPLTMRTLNYCCSADEVDGHYFKVFHGYRFQENLIGKRRRIESLKEKYAIEFYMNETDSENEDDNET